MKKILFAALIGMLFGCTPVLHVPTRPAHYPILYVDAYGYVYYYPYYYGYTNYAYYHNGQIHYYPYKVITPPAKPRITPPSRPKIIPQNSSTRQRRTITAVRTKIRKPN